MTINCVWEHNGRDTLLYAVDFVGAYTRGETLEAAVRKMQTEICSYLKWCGKKAVTSMDIVIIEEKVSELAICDADSDVLFESEKAPLTAEEYRKYYKICDALPFAFTDIEMVFNEEKKAVDWIFRYGNEALAALEKQPVDKMIGSSFSSLFSNMDSKWLQGFDRATLYGETLEIMDYSPEIDTNLKIICFPTFPGHCGCILFNADKMKSISEENHLVRLVEVSMKSNSSK